MATNTFGTFTTPSFRKQYLDETKDDEFDLESKPLFQTVSKTAEGQMAGQTPGFDVQATEAREAFKAAQAYQQKALREQLMGAGLRDSGTYIEEGIITPEREALRQRMALERGLASDRETRSQANIQAGMQTGTSLLGMQSEAAQERARLAQEAVMQEKQIGSTEKVAFAGLSLQDKELAQNAMQFNDRLSFDRWATQSGLDQQTAQRVWEGVENEKDRLQQQTLQEQQIQSTEKVAFAGLSLQEKELAQNAMQFKDRLSFDQWATQAGLDDNQKNRIWESTENEKNRILQTTMQTAELGSREGIAAMQNDTERWKTVRAEALTQQGWSHEDAMQQALFEQQTTQANLDRELEREGLSLEEIKIANQASQFASEQEFQRWATQAGLDDSAASRIWQANENALTRTQEATLAREKMTQERDLLGLSQTFQAGESALDRTLQSEIEAGRIASQDADRVQQASQFATQQEFNTWAKNQDMDDATAQRVWQSAENVLIRAHDETMQELSGKFAQKGIALDAVLANLQNMDSDQAAETFRQIAAENDIVIPDMGSKLTGAEIGTGTYDKPSITYGEGSRVGGTDMKVFDGTTWTPTVDGQIVEFDRTVSFEGVETELPAGKYQRTGTSWKNLDTGKIYEAKAPPPEAGNWWDAQFR